MNRSRPASPSPSAPRGSRRIGTPLDRFDLYEICVTDGPRLARFLNAAHGRRPVTLREDFSGTGALARAWASMSPRHHAVAVDRDPEPLARCAGLDRVRTVVGDAARRPVRADIVAATNFPVGYWHDRGSLVRYLRTVRGSLRPRGIFACDTYGGSDAFRALTLERRVHHPRATRIDQQWEQRHANPATGMVTDVLHFRVRDRGARRDRVLRDAFVYRWRLWSIPELREAMLEAGFRAVEVFDRLGSALDHRGRLHLRALADGDPLDENYVVYLVGRR